MAKKCRVIDLREITVESRTLLPNEKIKEGTLLTDHDEQGYEWFLIAQSGFGMNRDNSHKILGPIGKGLNDLKRNLDRRRKELKARRKAKAKAEKSGKEFVLKVAMDEIDCPLGYFHRTRGVRVVTSKVELDLTGI